MSELERPGLAQLRPGLKVNTSSNQGIPGAIQLDAPTISSITSRPSLDASPALEPLTLAQSAPLPTSALANLSQIVNTTIGAISNAALFNGGKSGVTLTQLSQMKTAGSHNVVITTIGTSPASNSQFVRKEMVSVVVN